MAGSELARLEILFDTPAPGATRIRTCEISRADRVARLQAAIVALAEAVAILGGTVKVADLADSRTCARCGQMFRGLRSDALYCSLSCRQGAYRDRRKDPGYPPQTRIWRQRRAPQPRPARERTHALVRHWFE